MGNKYSANRVYGSLQIKKGNTFYINRGMSPHGGAQQVRMPGLKNFSVFRGDAGACICIGFFFCFIELLYRAPAECMQNKYGYYNQYQADKIFFKRTFLILLRRKDGCICIHNSIII